MTNAVAQSGSQRLDLHASRAIRIVPTKGGCCACAQRWAYPQIQNPSFRLVEGQQLVFQVLPDATLDAYIRVENISSQPVRFGVRIDTMRKSVFHRVNFCSGEACYPSFILESDPQGEVTLQPGEIDHTFKLQFDPQGMTGESVIGVVIYNVADWSDYISFDVTFSATILSVEERTGVVSVVPNPATEVVMVRAGIGAHVEIVDPLGRLLRSEVLHSDRAAISVSDLPSGAYRVVVRSGERIGSYPLQILR